MNDYIIQLEKDETLKPPKWRYRLYQLRNPRMTDLRHADALATGKYKHNDKTQAAREAADNMGRFPG